MTHKTKTAQTTVWIMEIAGERVHIVPLNPHYVTVVFRGSQHERPDGVSLPPSVGLLEDIAEDIWWEYLRETTIDCETVAKAVVSESMEATAAEIVESLTDKPERWTDPCGRLIYHNQRSPE